MKIYKLDMTSNNYKGCGSATIAVNSLNQVVDYNYNSNFAETRQATIITDRRCKLRDLRNKNFKNLAKECTLNFYNNNKQNWVNSSKKMGLTVYSATISCGEAVVVGDWCQL
jgi:hypothetical protein